MNEKRNNQQGEAAMHTFKNIGGKDYHYINGELAFVDGRPQPRYAGSTEGNPKRLTDEEMGE